MDFFTEHPYQVTISGVPALKERQLIFKLTANMQDEHRDMQRLSIVGTPEQLREFLAELMIAVSDVSHHTNEELLAQ